jgi:hypothetical protein
LKRADSQALVERIASEVADPVFSNALASVTSRDAYGSDPALVRMWLTADLETRIALQGLLATTIRGAIFGVLSMLDGVRKTDLPGELELWIAESEERKKYDPDLHEAFDWGLDSQNR